MQLLIKDIVPAARLDEIRRVLAAAEFRDGRESAGFMARVVKSNEQAAMSPELEELREDLVEAVRASPVFAMAARPKSIIGTLFSRYGEGQAYGSHVDNAIIDGERTDASFTLFLSDPASYDGGELVLETALGEDAIKADAGTLFTYPSTMLHRVAPVTRGTRLALVGWVRSRVRDAARRELLFDLETAERSLFAREGKTREVDLLARSLANLMRIWVED